MILTKTSVDNHLVKVEEDNEAILRVELDKAHLLAEVLDHHPGLPLLGLASQRVGSKLWLSRLEEEMPAHKKMIDRIVESLATFSGAFPDQGGEKADGRLAAPLTSTLLLPEPFNVKVFLETENSNLERNLAHRVRHLPSVHSQMFSFFALQELSGNCFDKHQHSSNDWLPA